MKGAAERWRVFLAVELPASVKRKLASRLDALGVMGDLVRPSPPEGIHLTLHFLGHLELPRIDELAAAVEPVIADHARFALEVFGLGAFPSMARPRILWAGIEGQERSRLVELQSALGRALASAGFAVEARPYAPHLTLGRLRRPPRARDRDLLQRWQAEGSASLGRLPVDAISLVRSELGFRPPRHTVLRAFRLQ